MTSKFHVLFRSSTESIIDSYRNGRSIWLPAPIICQATWTCVRIWRTFPPRRKASEDVGKSKWFLFWRGFSGSFWWKPFGGMSLGTIISYVGPRITGAFLCEEHDPCIRIARNTFLLFLTKHTKPCCGVTKRCQNMLKPPKASLHLLNPTNTF